MIDIYKPPPPPKPVRAEQHKCKLPKLRDGIIIDNINKYPVGTIAVCSECKTKHIVHAVETGPGGFVYERNWWVYNREEVPTNYTYERTIHNG